jgi:hypothetical protein
MSTLRNPGALALILCCSSIFTAGIGAGYLFDDASSVLPVLTLRGSPELFWEVVFNDRSGPLGRPVSIFSFAIEQLWFPAGPSFSQAISVGVHALNALMVFYLGSLVFSVLNFPRSTLLALFLALLWACAPQKVSSVLYITQRMTLLATSFVLLTLISYVKARRSRDRYRQSAWLAAAILSAIFAPFAKETGVLAVPTAAAIELFVFAGVRKTLTVRVIRGAAFAILALGLIGFCYVGFSEYLRSDVSFAGRNFSFADRLLSSPGILVDYARQFFIPDVGKMGVLHDDFPLLGPRQRPLAYSVSVLLVAGACFYLIYTTFRQQKSLLATGLAIFLIGHSLETFYFPLELYFEHRNYFPSLGLAFASIAAGRSICRTWRPPKLLITAFASTYLFIGCALTLSLALVWRDSSTLLIHHLSGHKDSSRANAEMSFLMAKLGQEQSAHSYLARAIELASREPAAKPLGSGDHIVLQLVVSCLSGSPFGEQQISASTHERQAESSGSGLHSPAIRALKTAFNQRHCVDADWSLASSMIQSFVGSQVDSGRSIDWLVLRDLVALERDLGHPFMMFVYAQMGIEARPDDGMFQLMKLEAALTLGESNAVNEALRKLLALDSQGKLRPRERRLFLVARDAV